MKIVTTDQMRCIDETTIRERGVPGSALMDRAGKAVAREALECFEPDAVAVVVGKGNNAGDGFVAARVLHGHGLTVTLYLLEDPQHLSDDARDAWESVPEGVRRVIRPSPASLREEMIQYDLVVDALFGTGLRGPLREPWTEYIEAINTCCMNVLSIDIPSGLSADLGAKTGPHIRATMTVTIGLPKLGLIFDPGVRASGRVVVADIGFPNDLIQDDALTINLMTSEEVARLLPRRSPSGHKGTFGHALILGGSEGMTGAAILTARAAMRSGVGLVFAAYPRPLGHIMETCLIEPIKIPLDGERAWFEPEQAEAVAERAAEMQAVAIGPGLGRRPETREFLRRIIFEVEAPLVIDADGLNLLAEHVADLARRPGPTILTPHPGEAARLLGVDKKEVKRNRLDAFVPLADRYGVTVVLKGAQTVVTEPDGERHINPTGNSGLAKGGSGDVLTGLIAGLLAQRLSTRDAACLGVFLHGLAADLAAERHGVRAMIPSDVVDALGPAFLRLRNSE